MAKWSTAKWGGDPKPETLPDSAFAFLIKDKEGKVRPRHRVVGRSCKLDGLHRYNNFMEALYQYWGIIEDFFWEEMGNYIEHEGKIIVQTIPYKSDWEIYRVKFNTPPVLTNQVIQAIKEKKLGTPRHMFY